MKKKRSRLELYACILKHLTVEPRTTRHIMLHENLSYTLTKECIQNLLKKGLLEVRLSDEGKSYNATPKGVEFIENYRKTVRVLGPS